MDTLALPMTSPSSLKRIFADAGLERSTSNHSTQADQPLSSNTLLGIDFPPIDQPQPSSITSALATSPLPKRTPSASVPVPKQHDTSLSAEKPNKKPKLTDAEREAKSAEKDFRDRQKAEDRARREEDRRAKESEREEKRRIKEEQTKLRNAEKQKKEEEKNKKARSQLRLNNFFVQPSVPNSGSTGSLNRDSQSPLSSRRSSISENNAVEASGRSQSILLTARKPDLSNYERHFPEFFIKPHTTLAPSNRFTRDEKSLSYVRTKIDEALGHDKDVVSESDKAFSKFDPQNLFHISSHQKPSSQVQVHAVKDIVAHLHGTARNPIDLTDTKMRKASQNHIELLKSIPVKYLKFREDVRPPYIGTYTKILDAHKKSKLGRNPFSRNLPEADYDYDSEAEWEEPGEGEDLDSEGEEELAEDEEEDEMEGFLDDEEANDVDRAARRRPMLGDLEPSCTGICWEEPNQQIHRGEGSPIDFQTLRLDILMENPHFPIDPYETSYWESVIPDPSLTSARDQNASMGAPRIPLNPIKRYNNAIIPPNNSKEVITDTSAAMKPPKPPKRLIPPDLMNDFKATVLGNGLTKLGLLEVLKQQFPKQSKDTIRETLDMIAERTGPKLAERRWVLKEGQ